MATINLPLSDEQSEILGYALTAALRAERDKLGIHGIGPTAKRGIQARMQRIEELRCLLDSIPTER